MVNRPFKPKLLILMICCALLFVGCSPSQQLGSANKVTVSSEQVSVIDGDTIKVKLENKTETVRFLLVDTPEIHDKKTGKAQPYSQEAKAFTSKMIANANEVTIEKDKSERDNYGRYLAYIYADDKSVQEALLQNGLAREAYIFEPNTKFEAQYRKVETTAKNKKIGIWSIPNYSQAYGFQPEAVQNSTKQPATTSQFIASKNSDVYHPATCSEIVNTIKPQNRIYFPSEDEAKASGRHRSQVKGCWD